MLSHFTEALKTKELRHEVANGRALRNRLVKALSLSDIVFQDCLRKLKAEGRSAEYDLLDFLRWKNSLAAGQKLQARHWKVALEEALQVMRTHWATVAAAAKLRLLQRTEEKWNEAQKLYLRWLLTPNTPQFFHLLKEKIPLPTYEGYKAMGLSDKELAKRSVFKTLPDGIRHMAYKALGVVNRLRASRVKAPCGRRSSNRIDFDSSSWTLEENNRNSQFISLMSLYRGQRLRMEVLGRSSLRGTLQLILDPEGYRLNVFKPVAALVNTHAEKLVGLDVGYTEVAVSDDGTHYGTGFGDVASEISDAQSERTRRRNKYSARCRTKRQGNAEDKKKARRIQKYNLGQKKQRELLRKAREHLKSLINRALNEFFEKADFTQLAIERLSTFLSNKGRKWNRRLTSWMRSYLKERLIFKAQKYGIELIEINLAYTSQTCPHCGFVDRRNRNGDRFKCLHCGISGDADRVGAINIARRATDKEISLYTYFRTVKQILLDRFKKSRLEEYSTV